MNIQLYKLPKLLKISLSIFLISLSFGYISGIDLLKHTTDFNLKGIEENIIGNEFDESAEELKFNMSEREIAGIIHSHVISLAILFLILSLLIFFSSYSNGIKTFFMIEPTISLILTFGGMWLLWAGISWFKYVIMISGILMHLSFVIIIILLLKDLIITK